MLNNFYFKLTLLERKKGNSLIITKQKKHNHKTTHRKKELKKLHLNENTES